MIILYIALLLLAALLGVVFIKALMFRPKPQNFGTPENIEFNGDEAISALAELVKCKTVSYYDGSLEDDAEFQKLEDLLPKLYPNVIRRCELTKFDSRALLFRWQGQSNKEPTVLMAHYDVVPVNEQNWEKPPFSAIIEDGVMWGRGTLDTKVTFNGILFAANTLIGMGYVPKNDIYLAFSGGEEINGDGAKNIVDYFENNGITPALVVDEGGGVVEDVFPGVKKQCALIGIAEKGMVNLEFNTVSAGGHASAPAPHTPIGILAKACAKTENKPFKMHLTEPAAEMFNVLGRHSNLVFRLIFANLWLFKPVLDLIAKKSGGEMNALLRTTVAFTQAYGSSAPNVIPPKASLVANLRLNPQDSMQKAVEYIKKTINDDSVELNVLGGMEPSRVSVTKCEAYKKVERAVANTWEGALVSPYLMVQCSDSRHYGRISDKVYRFSAMHLTKAERATVHGNNERIRLEQVEKATEFFIRLIKQC